MEFFSNTSNTVIEGGHFVNVLHGDAHFHTGNPRAGSQRGLDILRQNVAAGAFYDAAERADPPKCHPQTRLAVLSEIQEWVRNSETRSRLIIWLYGPAGSGKSAIAQTIAEIFAKERLLVASFFFSRTGIGRDDTSRFIASIAYQLSLSIPEIRGHIATAVEQDPLIFQRTLSSQMRALVIKPFNDATTELTQSTPAQPRLVIVDGLDEAREATTQRELLENLAASINQLPIPLIFLVASRPEYTIRQTFNREPLQSLMQGLALDDHYKPDNDIRVFLSAKFAEIRESHPPGGGLPVLWPSKEDMDYLVDRASGQFIYASTVMKYINSPRHNPTRRLKIIRGLSVPGKDTPFAQLDALYALILSSVEDIEKVRDILALVFLQTGYASYLSINFIETLMEYEPGDVTTALIDMHALVHVPSAEDPDNDNRLHMYHASLHDFLMDESRSQRFFLKARARHLGLALRLFRYTRTVPANEYKEDIFLTMFNGFIGHYLEISHTKDLVNELNSFSLASLLSNIPLGMFYATKWDAFFHHLRSECSQTDTGLYQRLRNEFDTWIRTRYQQYPESILACFSAACAIPSSWMVPYLPDIFDILAHSLPFSEAVSLRKIDHELFRFQEMSSLEHADFNGYDTGLGVFFADPTRAGVLFADGTKFTTLVEELVKVLCPRGEARFPIVVENRPYESSHSEWYETLQIEFGNMEFFPRILNATPQDLKLARLLWELAVQYKADDMIIQGRKRIADASLEYIKKCGISIPRHVHKAECEICASYKPVFPSPALERSTPDELETSTAVGDTSSASQDVPLTIAPMSSPSPTVVAPSALSSRSQMDPLSSAISTRRTPTIASPSTSDRFSSFPLTSSFSTAAHSSIRNRPNLGNPPPNLHHPSNSLSAASSRHPPTSNISQSGSSFLSPSTLTQASASSLHHSNDRHGQRLNRDGAPNASAPPQQRQSTPKKPLWNRMWGVGK